MAPVRNIIFDFGGVLFDIDYFAPARAFQQLGFENFGQFFSQATQHVEFDLLDRGSISNEDFIEFLRSHIPSVSAQQIKDAWNSILIGLRTEEIDFVRRLRGSGYRTFLLSNTNALHVEAFEKMIRSAIGMDAFHAAFDHVYYSNVIGRRKPDPETFRMVCEWNDLVPSETLFLDDTRQHIEGAERAGLRTVYLAEKEKPSLILPDWLGFS